MDYNQSNAIVDKDGKQKVTGAYTIGRQDVVSGTTKIRAGVSDELKLDFTVNNTLFLFSIIFDLLFSDFSAKSSNGHKMAIIILLYSFYAANAMMLCCM